MRYEIEDATEDHARALAPNLSDADKAELWAALHKEALDVLLKAISRDNTYVALVDGRPVCMFGCVRPNMLSDFGVPWLLGSEEIRQHRRVFLDVSKVYVGWLAERHSFLFNYVDARHTRAIAWLRWLGFTIHPAKAWGLDLLPFHLFTMDCRHV